MCDLMGDKLTIRELVNKLNKATAAYDKSTPIMTDKEWDDLYFELKEREKSEGIIYPDSPTQIIYFENLSKLKKVVHNHPMLSLAKTKSIDDVEKFVGGRPCLVMLKLDGLTISLRYLYGELVSAETRGNGEVGEDVTHNARVIPSIPKTIPTKEQEVIVDGELICEIPTFQAKFADKYKNPRNYAAGAIRRLDARENEDSGLTFVAWDWINGKYDLLSDNIGQLTEWGFRTVPATFYPVPDYYWSGDQEEITFENYIERAKQYTSYPIDGIVIKYNDVKYYQSLGATEHHFNGGLAYKFYDEEYETTLEDIDYDVSRNGILTPVAVFKPIDIDGSMVERASLHNMSVMEEVLGTPYYGERIWVYKANMIIPQISKADKRTYPEILKANGCVLGDNHEYGVACPVCGWGTAIKTSDTGVKILYCTNPECQGRLAQKIDYYCGKKGLDIKGISRATIEKLIDWGWINELSDIYKLESHKIEWKSKPGFGEASVNKIINAINTEGKHTTLESFISALGIPLVGKAVAKELCKHYTTWDDFMDAVDANADWSVFEGIGPEISKAINNFDFTEALEISKMIHISQVEQVVVNNNNSISGKTFVVTGKLNSFKNRDELKADIEKLGGKVASAISAKTDYLINNDINSTSSKNVQAKKQGIPIITEADYLKMKA